MALAGFAGAAVFVRTNFIQPVLIDPLFHQFRPLPDKTLEAKILAQAARAGIAGSRVYVADLSLDTKLDNAYVTGLFGTRRIVFWDTTLKDFNEDELLFVLGHEMGHYVLHHLIQLIAVASLLAFVSLYMAYRLAGPVMGRFKHRWGFDTPYDFAALPLFLLVIQLLVFVDLPIYMAFSRHVEHEADRFGLELTHRNHAAATAFVKFVQNGVSVYRPAPIIHFWYGPTPHRRNGLNSAINIALGKPASRQNTRNTSSRELAGSLGKNAERQET